VSGLWLGDASAGRECAPAALDRRLLGGPSTSPLGEWLGVTQRPAGAWWALLRGPQLHR
jgi:hypothetical protein